MLAYSQISHNTYAPRLRLTYMTNALHYHELIVHVFTCLTILDETSLLDLLTSIYFTVLHCGQLVDHGECT